MNAILCYKDGTKRIQEVEIEKINDILYCHMPEKTDYKNVEFIDFAVDYAVPRTGEQGYLVCPEAAADLVMTACAISGKEKIVR